MRSLKMIIIIRDDLNMRKGKMIAQGSHASDNAISNSDESMLNLWHLESHSTKIVVSVKSEKELIELHEKAKATETLNVGDIIVDEGFTEFNRKKTMTAFAIGPNFSDEVDEITSSLKLL